MPAVVSDTSPLVDLTRLGHFGWLKVLYGEVLIPPAVWNELITQGAGYPEAAETKMAVKSGWIKVSAPAAALAELSELDPGEREAIALAKELDALLIINEAEERSEAMRLGIRVVGTLGLMIEAKSRGLTASVRRELDRLAGETTFRISDELRKQVLLQAGEPES